LTGKKWCSKMYGSAVMTMRNSVWGRISAARVAKLGDRLEFGKGARGLRRPAPASCFISPGLKGVGRGTPGWAGLSTNASCQPEKPENSHLKTRGPASTIMRAHPRMTSLPTGESPATRENLRNVGDTGDRGGERCCQQSRRLE